jgi:hypothetical protein
MIRRRYRHMHFLMQTKIQMLAQMLGQMLAQVLGQGPILMHSWLAYKYVK